MGTLEDILDITAAIRKQKKDRKKNMGRKKFPRLDRSLFERGKSQLDLGARIKEEIGNEKGFLPISDEELFENEEKRAYNPLKLFKGYVSMFKNKLYEYYSAVKDTFNYSAVKDTFKELAKAFDVGYTDKLLKEMEDWGYFCFKTVFHKLKRLTPHGAASRYLQELYVAVVKTIK